MTQGSLYIISAPSGAGKTTLVKKLLATTPNVVVSVSHTTRQARFKEIDGQDYFFVSNLEFEQLQKQQAFLESAQVFDNFYGTAQKTVEENLTNGLDVILEIDWQGAQQVKHRLPNSISIFIIPPSIDALKQRLKNRAQDSDEIITRRMNDAVNEMRHYAEFDYLVVNDYFDMALKELKSIIFANRLLIKRQSENLQALLENLLN